MMQFLSYIYIYTGLYVHNTPVPAHNPGDATNKDPLFEACIKSHIVAHI